MKSIFPDPRTVRGDVIAFGDDLRTSTLREAYRKGIFPWPNDETPLPWFSPRRRAVLFFDELHVGRSLRRLMREPLTFTVDRAFDQVIHACSTAPRPGQHGTWITPEVRDAYIRLHRAGDAHSIEAWWEGKLVGGLYGVDAGGVFTGESMFHRRSGASKLALLFAAAHLRSRGSAFLDCQVMTPHMEALGAREITRSRFLDMLAAAQASAIELFPPTPPVDPGDRHDR